MHIYANEEQNAPGYKNNESFLAYKFSYISFHISDLTHLSNILGNVCGMCTVQNAF